VFVLSVPGGIWSLPDGVSGGEGSDLIQLAPIYSVLGLIMLAVLSAVLGVPVQTENCRKNWQRTAAIR